MGRGKCLLPFFVASQAEIPLLSLGDFFISVHYIFSYPAASYLYSRGQMNPPPRAKRGKPTAFVHVMRMLLLLMPQLSPIDTECNKWNFCCKKV